MRTEHAPVIFSDAKETKSPQVEQHLREPAQHGNPWNPRTENSAGQLAKWNSANLDRQALPGVGRAMIRMRRAIEGGYVDPLVVSAGRVERGRRWHTFCGHCAIYAYSQTRKKTHPRRFVEVLVCTSF